jgi:CBS domain-containing protein
MATARSPWREDVVSVPPTAFLDQVAETMAGQDVGSVVVTDGSDELAGIVTDRDLALTLREDLDPTTTTAEDVMTTDLVTVKPGTHVFEMLETMRDEDVRRLPVVDEAGDPVRLVTLDDTMVLLGEELADVAELIERQV